MSVCAIRNAKTTSDIQKLSNKRMSQSTFDCLLEVVSEMLYALEMSVAIVCDRSSWGACARAFGI